MKAVKDHLEEAGSSSLRIVGAVAVVALLLLAVVLWRHYAASESTDDAQIDGHIHPVATRVGGTVQQVLVRDNQQVTAARCSCRSIRPTTRSRSSAHRRISRMRGRPPTRRVRAFP